MKISARTDTRNLDRLISNLPAETNKAVRLTAFEIEREAKEEAPVDTGALRAGIFTVTNREDGSTGALASAKSPRPDKTGKVKIAGVIGDYPKPQNSNQAYVVGGTDYTKVVHEVHPSKSHFLLKAAWRARSRFRERIRKIFRGESI